MIKGGRMNEYADYDCRIQIWIRVPFTMYFLCRLQGECKHEWSKFYLAVKVLRDKGYTFKIIA